MNKKVVFLTADTQDICTSSPGMHEEVFCGVCGALMRSRRDQHGPTSYAMSMANMKRDYDYFECPLRMSHWHQKVVKIREFMKTVPSNALCRVMREECDELLEGEWRNNKGLIGGEMWLLPRMHNEARETQEVWEEEMKVSKMVGTATICHVCFRTKLGYGACPYCEATLNGNTSGTTERPG